MISFCREKKTLNISSLLQKLGRNFVNKNIMDIFRELTLIFVFFFFNYKFLPLNRYFDIFNYSVRIK